MQPRWDNLDEKIISSIGEVTVSENYNEKLLMKLHNKNLSYRNYAIPGASFIAAGLILFAVYNTDLLYYFSLIEWKLRNMAPIYSNKFISTVVLKYFLGA